MAKDINRQHTGKLKGQQTCEKMVSKDRLLHGQQTCKDYPAVPVFVGTTIKEILKRTSV